MNPTSAYPFGMPRNVDPTAFDAADRRTARAISESLALVEQLLMPRRRVLRPGDLVYEAGCSSGNLYVISSGFVKVVSLCADGREQVVACKFCGDWLGFDGIASPAYACDAVAMDICEVLTVRYDALLATGAQHPELLTLMHAAMSRQLAQERHRFMSVCTLAAGARVAEFLHYWSRSLAERGLRNDQITLPMTRAEIGNYLGMALESASRALSRLARDGIISFSESGRREIQILDVGALAAVIGSDLAAAA